MNRRHFSSQLLGLGLGASALAGATSARAQGVPIEGTNYLRLSTPVPVNAPAGKFEVIEFFWYGCPHCNAFEPALEAWVKKLPPDVTFRRVPVAFREVFAVHQRIYYALEALGKVDAMQSRVFAAIHVEHLRLEDPKEIADWMAKNGIDRAKFVDAFNSFSVQTQSKQANRLGEAYKIDGVPAIGIHGRYFTSGSLNGTPERALAVTDYLLDKLRKGA